MEIKVLLSDYLNRLIGQGINPVGCKLKGLSGSIHIFVRMEDSHVKVLYPTGGRQGRLRLGTMWHALSVDSVEFAGLEKPEKLSASRPGDCIVINYLELPRKWKR